MKLQRLMDALHDVPLDANLEIEVSAENGIGLMIVEEDGTRSFIEFTEEDDYE